MGERYLHQKCPFLKALSQEKREQFEIYFRTAPDWLIDSLVVEKIKKGTTFIRENNPADTIYFIVEGLIVATDYRVLGVSYDFMQFQKMYAFGGMEFIMDLDVYKTSLRTVTDSIAVKISRAMFEKWMYSDIKALKYESKLIGEYLLEQARNVIREDELDIDNRNVSEKHKPRSQNTFRTRPDPETGKQDPGGKTTVRENESTDL